MYKPFEPGDRINKLVLIRKTDLRTGSNRIWEVRCDCGKVFLKNTSGLRKKTTYSCGECERPDRSHGESRRANKTAEYRAWAGMKKRCENKSDISYPRYGGRGVKVCERWSTSFEDFLVDVGRRPSTEHSLDRIDNSRGYEPGNVRWATAKEQARNRRSSHYETWAGMTLTLAEWCELAGVRYGLVMGRLTKGWPWPQALYVPKGQTYILKGLGL